jgi:drug/metabolite transporter (DMT)-like permease
MLFAGIGMLPILLLRYVRRRGRFVRNIDPVQAGARSAGYLCAAAGAVLGPYLGVWMSLEASDRVSLGIAQTLCSLPPIFILPFAAMIHHERTTRRAVLGALIAVAGVTLLFQQSA